MRGCQLGSVKLLTSWHETREIVIRCAYLCPRGWDVVQRLYAVLQWSWRIMYVLVRAANAKTYGIGFAVHWKSNFNTFAWTFASKMLEIGHRLRMSQSFLLDIQSCFPFLKGPSCRKSPSALFQSNYDRSNTINISPIGFEKKSFFRSGRGL